VRDHSPSPAPSASAVPPEQLVLAARANRTWRADDIAILRAHYGTMPVPELAAMLGRSPRSVYQAAQLHDLKRAVQFVGTRPRPVADRFWPKVDTSGDCWLWIARSAVKGYGQLSVIIDGKRHSKLATHVAWFLEHQRWPVRGMELCHRCDTPQCVRIDHLYEGTKSDNMRDMWTRNREAAERAAAKGREVIQRRRQARACIAAMGAK
jgi:hypothetical protein